MKLTTGDVFSIKTNVGIGFLQYIDTDDLGIDLIRVLEPINESALISQNEIDKPERWCCGFTINAARRQKFVDYIDNFEVPRNFKTPTQFRSKHLVRGEMLGWFIIERNSLKRNLIQKLRKEHLKLSPHGFMTAALIIERIESNWHLKEWC